MNLEFVAKPEEREELVRLLARTGNSRLLETRNRNRNATILQGLGSRDYLESCSYLGETDLSLASKGRSDKLLRECLVETIKSGNSSVASILSGPSVLYEPAPAFLPTAYWRDKWWYASAHLFQVACFWHRQGNPLPRGVWKQLVCLSDLKQTNTAKQTATQQWRPNSSRIPTDVLEKTLLYAKLQSRDPEHTVLL